MDDVGPDSAQHPGDRAFPANEATDVPDGTRERQLEEVIEGGPAGLALPRRRMLPRRRAIPFARSWVAIGVRNWRTVPETVAT